MLFASIPVSSIKYTIPDICIACGGTGNLAVVNHDQNRYEAYSIGENKSMVTTTTQSLQVKMCHSCYERSSSELKRSAIVQTLGGAVIMLTGLAIFITTLDKYDQTLEIILFVISVISGGILLGLGIPKFQKGPTNLHMSINSAGRLKFNNPHVREYYRSANPSRIIN